MEYLKLSQENETVPIISGLTPERHTSLKKKV